MQFDKNDKKKKTILKGREKKIEKIEQNLKECSRAKESINKYNIYTKTNIYEPSFKIALAGIRTHIILC